MNLHDKPLYAVRDLAKRLGIAAPTKPKKDELIALIEERKKELESCKPTQQSNRLGKPLLGRPRLNNSYIAIKTDFDGKITFYDAEQPESENFADNEPRVIIKKYPPAIKDAETRKTLADVKSLLQSLWLAIDKVLDRE